VSPFFAVDHGLFQMMAAGYVGFRSCAMARKRRLHILFRLEPVNPAKGRIFREIRPVAGKRRVVFQTSLHWAASFWCRSSYGRLRPARWKSHSRSLSSLVSATRSTAFSPSASNMASELGALLDPLADKALLVSIYIALGIWAPCRAGSSSSWSRADIMIVTAVIVSWFFGKPIPMKPLMVSKLNTVAQVAFAALVLAALGFGFKPTPYDTDPDGLGNDLYFGSVSALSRGVGAAHEHDRSTLDPGMETCVAGHVQPVSLHSRCRTQRALRATIFWKDPANAGRAGAGRQLARLAEPDHAAAGTGGFRQEPSRRDLGRGSRRTLDIGACADRSRSARRAGHRRAAVVEDLKSSDFDERALFHT